MKHKLRIFSGLAFMLIFAFTMPAYGAEDAPLISTEQSRDMLDNPDLVLLDVRTESDWEKSDRKIAGAVRVDPKDVNSWTGNYSKDQKIILYCA